VRQEVYIDGRRLKEEKKKEEKEDNIIENNDVTDFLHDCQQDD
jgi:hypothetical protein